MIMKGLYRWVELAAILQAWQAKGLSPDPDTSPDNWQTVLRGDSQCEPAIQRKKIWFIFCPYLDESLSEVYEALRKVPNVTVYKKPDIPAHYHYKNTRRVTPILVVADLHYSLSFNKSVINKTRECI